MAEQRSLKPAVRGSTPRRRTKEGHAARLAALAEYQRDTGQDLAAEVTAARADGMTWEQIGAVLGLPYPTVLRQHKAGSPIVVIRPYHPGGTGRRGGPGTYTPGASSGREPAPGV